MAKSNFRIHKNYNYTIMSNCSILDKGMSCGAKGLLAIMLSFRGNRTFQISDLEAVCAENRTHILGMLEELERFGYVEVIETTPTCVYEAFEYSSKEEC